MKAVKTQKVLSELLVTAMLSLYVISLTTSQDVVHAAVQAEATQKELKKQIPVTNLSVREETLELFSEVPLEGIPKTTDNTPKATTEKTPKLIVHERYKVGSAFKFPTSVTEGARKYLEEVYNQAHEASKDTAFPDPFMAMALSVMEMPVSDSEVFRLPLVYQDTLKQALKESGGDYSSAIQYSSDKRSYKKYACVGPLQMASGWVEGEQRNPTIWLESCQMFYEDAELAIPGFEAFAEKCDIPVTDTFLRTLAVMRHNVGNLSDWEYSSPDSSTGRQFIPFKSKRAVYEWNEAVSSDKAQELIKKAAYDSYISYLSTGVYDNEGIGWREVADEVGYTQSNITSDSEWWRPLYIVRFWYNYHQLRLLYGADGSY